MRTAFIQALLEIAASDPRVWLVTGDLGYSVLEPFAERFPDRYLNAGVAEQSMVGLAGGLAASGATVFVYSIGNFPTLRALEQVRNDVALPRAAVTIVSVGSGFSYGAQGSTHHAIEDIGVMRALPSMTVVSPGDPRETVAATTMLAARRAPGYLRLGKAGEAEVPGVESFELGRLRLLRDGSDVTILATGSILGAATTAADELAASGIQARLYSAHTLRPFDNAALARAVAETGGLVTVEEHRLIGGLRSVVAESLLGGPPVSIATLGIDSDRRLPTGSQGYLRGICGITAADIVAAVYGVLNARDGKFADSPKERGRR